MPLVIHLVESSARHPWVENQMVFFKEYGFDQGLLSIAAPGEIHEVLRLKSFHKVQSIKGGISGFVRTCLTLIEWSKEEAVYIYAHGHLASVYASFMRSLTGIDFIICHHQQPEFFPLLRKKKYLRASIHMALARYYLIRARKIQSFSPEVTRSLIGRGVKAQKIVEIPLGMNFESYFELGTKSTQKSTPKAISIVAVSRLAWEKRMDLGIRSVARVLELGTPINFRIVGEGPELSNLADLIKDLGVEDHISLLGWCGNVNEILNESDVFFHLSLTESYGQVLMEARLSGVPIFSSPCGVALEMEKLKDPKVHVFNSADPKIIAEEFIQFLDKIESQRSMTAPDPRDLYMHHEYLNVLHEVAEMFHELVNYDS